MNCHTCLEARYSIPRAIWYANDIKSFSVNGLSEVFSNPGFSYPVELGGLLDLRKSRKFPFGANSTTTYNGPKNRQQSFEIIIFTKQFEAML